MCFLTDIHRYMTVSKHQRTNFTVSLNRVERLLYQVLQYNITCLSYSTKATCDIIFEDFPYFHAHSDSVKRYVLLIPSADPLASWFNPRPQTVFLKERNLHPR